MTTEDAADEPKRWLDRPLPPAPTDRGIRGVVTCLRSCLGRIVKVALLVGLPLAAAYVALWVGDPGADKSKLRKAIDSDYVYGGLLMMGAGLVLIAPLLFDWLSSRKDVKDAIKSCFGVAIGLILILGGFEWATDGVPRHNFWVIAAHVAWLAVAVGLLIWVLKQDKILSTSWMAGDYLSLVPALVVVSVVPAAVGTAAKAITTSKPPARSVLGKWSGVVTATDKSAGRLQVEVTITTTDVAASRAGKMSEVTLDARARRCLYELVATKHTGDTFTFAQRVSPPDANCDENSIALRPTSEVTASLRYVSGRNKSRVLFEGPVRLSG